MAEVKEETAKIWPLQNSVSFFFPSLPQVSLFLLPLLPLLLCSFLDRKSAAESSHLRFSTHTHTHTHSLSLSHTLSLFPPIVLFRWLWFSRRCSLRHPPPLLLLAVAYVLLRQQHELGGVSCGRSLDDPLPRLLDRLGSLLGFGLSRRRFDGDDGRGISARTAAPARHSGGRGREREGRRGERERERERKGGTMGQWMGEGRVK